VNEVTLGPALLFCPADRPERYAKAAERADGVILDLEDAVAPGDKTAARGALIEAELDPDRTIVRVSAPGTDAFVADLATLSQTDFRTVMVAKTESVKALKALDARFRIVALCETAKGVGAAEKLAASDRVIGLMWGAEDLVASLGGTASRDGGGRYRDIARYARARVLLAARAHGKAAIDAVHLDIADTAGLRAEAEDAAASGFTATACIHPSQAPIIRAAYRPHAKAVAWAEGVLRAAEGAGGVFRHEGQMVDEPVLVHARRILERSRG
jgi:citrate lyase subunit beta/citryl-CoA lyase